MRDVALFRRLFPLACKLVGTRRVIGPSFAKLFAMPPETRLILENAAYEWADQAHRRR